MSTLWALRALAIVIHRGALLGPLMEKAKSGRGKKQPSIREESSASIPLPSVIPPKNNSHVNVIFFHLQFTVYFSRIYISLSTIVLNYYTSQWGSLAYAKIFFFLFLHCRPGGEERKKETNHYNSAHLK